MYFKFNKKYYNGNATENINLYVAIYVAIVALAFNGISILVFLKATDLEYFFRGNRSENILIGTFSTLKEKFEVF